MRDRTADLNTASVALSQLSYSPVNGCKLLILLDFSTKEINNETGILVTGAASVNSRRSGSGFFPGCPALDSLC